MNHPCKETCSGYKQGFEEGVAETDRKWRERIEATKENDPGGNMVTHAFVTEVRSQMRCELLNDEEKR